MLCREVLVMEIFKYPKRSKERGEIWQKISTCLNSTSAIKFTVNKRSVRDRLTLLINKYKEKMNKEEKGSGITCDDETEVEIAVAEIIEKERAADLERKEKSNTLTKDENDKASAEEVRLKSMERLGQTKKRSADSECAEVAPPKSRRNASEAVQYLKEKFAQENEIRKEELEVRKKKQESHVSQYKLMMEQQQFQDVLKAMSEQQQRQERQMQNFQMMFFQQQSQLLMGLLEKVLPKSS